VTTSAPGRPVATEPPAGVEDLTSDPNWVARSPRTRPAARLQTWMRSYRLLLVFLDLFACAAAGFIAINRWPQARSGILNQELLLWIALVGLPLLWVALLWGHGAYEGRYLGLGPDEFKRVLKAVIALTALICFVAFTQKIGLSRKAVGGVLPMTLAITLTLRFLARKALHFARRRSKASQRLILVGTLGETLAVYRTVKRNPHAGLVPVEICLTEPTAETPELPIPVHNGKLDVIERVSEVGADTIAVCGARGVGSDSLRRLAWQLEGTGIDLVVAPSLTDIAGPRVHIRPVEGLPLLHVEEPTVSGIGWLLKGVTDRIAAFLGLLVLSPLLLATAVIIKLTSDGPVFFRQARAGRGGEMIRVWKFRTMYTDAEARLASLLGDNETDGLLFKMKDDPRITPAGNWLRRLSIDELPQLINVLVGDMSLVGPRPLPVQNEEFRGDVRRRLLVRPGITGLWQVSGRSNLSWEDAVRLDLYYVDNWSPMFDLMILWKTVFVVMQRDGAF
jgi:exopolysaccharide biosynthesis polyprenyl glycosylphosphotransferase